MHKAAWPFARGGRVLDHLITAYNEAIVDTDRERALRVVLDAEQRGVSPEQIVFSVVLPAMDAMMKSISVDLDANLAQHYLTAQIADTVTTAMIPKFAVRPTLSGKVVVGNAKGDLHALGRRILIGCLRARMVDVKDLGVNVAPERFVDEALAFGAQVIGISAMMVHTARGPGGCLKVRQLLRERELEGRLKLVVGGAAFRFDPHLYQTVGADAWAEDAVTGACVIQALTQERPALPLAPPPPLETQVRP
jgi:methanogenic corrinoid protein MtbC1